MTNTSKTLLSMVETPLYGATTSVAGLSQTPVGAELLANCGTDNYSLAVNIIGGAAIAGLSGRLINGVVGGPVLRGYTRVAVGLAGLATITAATGHYQWAAEKDAKGDWPSAVQLRDTSLEVLTNTGNQFWNTTKKSTSAICTGNVPQYKEIISDDNIKTFEKVGTVESQGVAGYFCQDTGASLGGTGATLMLAAGIVRIVAGHIKNYKCEKARLERQGD